MSLPSTQEVTRLLIAWSNGDRAALEHLMPIVYKDLRRLATRHLRGERMVILCKPQPSSMKLIYG